STIQKCGDRVYGYCPDYGKKNEGDVPLRIRRLTEKTHIQDVSADMQVQDQITIENNHVPGEHGHGKMEISDQRHEMPEAVRSSQINGDKEQTHDNSS